MEVLLSKESKNPTLKTVSAKDNSNILLTVPHGYSLAGKSKRELESIYKVTSHPQDFASLGFATKIRSHLGSYARVVVGDKPRFSPEGMECDLNRVWKSNRCFGDFTSQVAQWLESNEGSANAFLLDVHSYPSTSSYGDYDCYLLHFDTHQSVVSSLARYLEESGGSLTCANNHISGIRGTKDNYIISLATYKSIKTVLFEVNESLSEEKQERLAKRVAKWLTR